jgi:hypothetical protein
VVSEGGHAKVVVNRASIGAVQPSRAGQQGPRRISGGTGFAQRRPSGAARFAMTARRHEDEDDVVAG